MGPSMGDSQCLMPISRNVNVACHCFLFSSMSHVDFKKRICPMTLHFYSPSHVTDSPICRMSNLRNAHVVLSLLGVKGHLHDRVAEGIRNDGRLP